MIKPLNLGTFQDLLNTYGANIERWPLDVQDSAQNLLKQSDEAQILYMDELKLDQAIQGHHKDGNAPQGLMDKILNIPNQDE